DGIRDFHVTGVQTCALPICFSNGLIELKLRQLFECELIDKVVLSTNDDEILEYASSLAEDRLILHKRADHLASSKTSTDELVAQIGRASCRERAGIGWGRLG